LPSGRLEALCRGAEVVVLRNDFPPESCPAPLLLTGADFRRGGAAELFRQPGGGWGGVLAQDPRGLRPWTWGVGLRGTRTRSSPRKRGPRLFQFRTAEPAGCAPTKHAWIPAFAGTSG